MIGLSSEQRSNNNCPTTNTNFPSESCSSIGVSVNITDKCPLSSEACELDVTVNDTRSTETIDIGAIDTICYPMSFVNPTVSEVIENSFPHEDNIAEQLLINQAIDSHQLTPSEFALSLAAFTNNQTLSSQRARPLQILEPAIYPFVSSLQLPVQQSPLQLPAQQSFTYFDVASMLQHSAGVLQTVAPLWGHMAVPTLQPMQLNFLTPLVVSGCNLSNHVSNHNMVWSPGHLLPDIYSWEQSRPTSSLMNSNNWMNNFHMYDGSSQSSPSLDAQLISTLEESKSKSADNNLNDQKRD